ncbi:MAG: hypothetical protein DWQ18_09455 [Crenarchaeota archaeon]|nr:MAG: hypothetical protein DWQ17_00330 [Thermoproteota archaeon]RDJ33353.1 MAG: hypothetical protein DWQ18_09455 [Thermoproteota archaeon]
MIVFIIVFSLMFFLQYIVNDPTSVNEQNHPFYSKKFPENHNLVFIIGTSHVGQLNSTFINEEISSRFSNYEVYNLAHFKDNPQRREPYLDKILEFNPTIVFYGISHREFKQNSESNQNIILNFQNGFSEILSPEKFGFESINPKFNTLQIIRSFLDIPSMSIDDKMYDAYAPFFWYERPQTLISNEESLLRDDALITIDEYKIGDPTHNNQVNVFKNIIQKLQDNNVKVVIFTTPLNHHYLNLIDKNEITTFNMILDEISNEFNVDVYDFTEKYEELSIWMNPTHISYNKNAIIVSQDIANMIIQEIQE